MNFDTDRVVVVSSRYHQFHGKGVYNNPFADRVADELKELLETATRDRLSVGPADISFHHNGEAKVKIVPNVRRRHVYYIHDFRGPDGRYDPNVGYMSLLQVEDALAGSGRADKITLVLPHIPYLRGDWAPESRVPIPARLYAHATEMAARGKLDHIVTYDLHSPQEVAFYPKVIPDNLPFRPVVAERFKDIEGEIACASLDAGGVKPRRRLASSLAHLRGVESIPPIVIEKYRPRDGDAQIMEVVGNPQDKTVIIIEDMIDTGGSAAEAAKALYEKGAKTVYICATDGLFSNSIDQDGGEINALERLKESGAKIVISDSIPQPTGFEEEHNDFVEVLSLAPTAARAVYEIETIGSISTLYDD